MPLTFLVFIRRAEEPQALKPGVLAAASIRALLLARFLDERLVIVLEESSALKPRQGAPPLLRCASFRVPTPKCPMQPGRNISPSTAAPPEGGDAHIPWDDIDVAS